MNIERFLGKKVSGKDSYECHICSGEGLRTDDEGKIWCKTCIIRSIRRTPMRSEKRPGRNDKCYCTSGKKYKSCCLKENR